MDGSGDARLGRLYADPTEASVSRSGLQPDNRALADSRSISGATSIWADGEWIIAVARDQTDGIEVVAYEPRRDRWRHLPGISGSLGEENQLVWTGTELLLMNAADGLYRLDRAADSWTEASDASEGMGWIVWTGDRLIGLKSSFRAAPSLFTWDPGSDSWAEIAVPRQLVDGALFWTGQRVLLAGSGLALDPSTSDWWNVAPAPGFDPYEGVQIWAGDRLLALAGPQYHPVESAPFGRAWIPDW
jgi:hypothetical protein